MKLTKPTHKPGDKIDGYIYVGVIKDYHLLCNTEDEPEVLTWHEANKLGLPTREELSLMYANKDLISGFRDNYYWSSTEYDDFTSWIQRFSGGRQGYGANKYDAAHVRCVRRVPLFDEVIKIKIAALEAELKELKGKL